MHKIRFVVNPVSGVRGDRTSVAGLIEETLRCAGQEFDVIYTNCRGDGVRLAQEASMQGYGIVAAVGGDGTVNEVGQGLMGSDAALAVIPAGSGNGFARNFNIPLDQREAVRLLLSPHVITIDAGKINNRYFFNVAGIGLDAAISQSFEHAGMRGMLTYFLIGAKTFFAYAPVPVKIKHEEGEVNSRPLLLSIANAPQYGSGAVIAPQAKSDDGLLDVCIIDTLPLWKAAANIYRLFNGTIDQMKGYHSFQTHSLTIERPGPGPIHTDGDPHQEEALLKIEVLPGRLRVVTGKFQAIS